MSRSHGNRRASATTAWVCLVAVALVCSAGVLPLVAQKSRPDAGTAASQPVAALKEIGIDQKPNAKLPLEAEFSDENGAPVKLGQFFGQRPVVMALVYYGCPMLCTQVLNGLAGSLQGLSFSAGQEYDVVVVSFDPGETPAMATERKTQFVSRYIRAADTSRIHFLTGRESSIKDLTTAVGFRYAWDKQTGQFAHPAAITVLTPDGRISRYLYGVEFAPKDLKLALIEASAGQIGSVADQAMLFCYHYDPETGRYGLAIMNLVRAAGALTVLVIGGWIFVSLRRERRQASAVARTATTGTR
jgi:protein SCO1/2